jgi:hypothetical protein
MALYVSLTSANVTFLSPPVFVDFSDNPHDSPRGLESSSNVTFDAVRTTALHKPNVFHTPYSITNITFYISRPDLVEILPATTFFAQYPNFVPGKPYTSSNFVIVLKPNTGVVFGDKLGYYRASMVVNGTTVTSQDTYIDAGSAANNPPVAPTAPSTVNAVYISGTYIKTTWNDLATNESKYQIQVSRDGSAFTALGETSANATQYFHTSATAGGSYRYRVRAVGATGLTSAWVFSNTVYR